MRKISSPARNFVSFFFSTGVYILSMTLLHIVDLNMLEKVLLVSPVTFKLVACKRFLSKRNYLFANINVHSQFFFQKTMLTSK